MATLLGAWRQLPGNSQQEGFGAHKRLPAFSNFGTYRYRALQSASDIGKPCVFSVYIYNRHLNQQNIITLLGRALSKKKKKKLCQQSISRTKVLLTWNLRKSTAAAAAYASGFPSTLKTKPSDSFHKGALWFIGEFLPFQIFALVDK